MMGHGYTGGNDMKRLDVKEKFAWLPLLTTSGKWIWRQKYFQLKETLWGPAGEGPVHDSTYYTVNEWLLEEIKHSRILPTPPAATSGIVPVNIPRQKPLTRR